MFQVCYHKQPGAGRGETGITHGFSFFYSNQVLKKRKGTGYKRVKGGGVSVTEQ